MTKPKEQLRCSVVTPMASVFDTEVNNVILPAHDGLLGVLPGHCSMLGTLGTGLLTYHDSKNVKHSLYIDTGFFHINENEITVLANMAVTPEQITAPDAKEQLIEAQSLPNSTIEEVNHRSSSIQRAKYLIKLVASSEDKT